MPMLEEGIVRLGTLLKKATGDPAAFDPLFARLQEVLREVLGRLEHDFAEQIERVLENGPTCLSHYNEHVLTVSETLTQKRHRRRNELVRR